VTPQWPGACSTNTQLLPTIGKTSFTNCVIAVLHEPLLQHSSRGMYPMASKSIPTTAFKPGFCDSQTPIAVELTQSFLDFASKSGGINLKQMGVRPGQRWCVEATRWQETLRHEKESGVQVPPVKLECTHESALKTVELDILKKYASTV
jgi:uncharacterized protein (DUF2237 family)